MNVTLVSRAKVWEQPLRVRFPSCNHNYSDDTMRRKRILSPTGLIATAVVAYGTYKLSRWLNGNDDDKHDKEEQDAGTVVPVHKMKPWDTTTLWR